MKDNLSREDRLICLCCRLNPNQEEELAIRKSIKQPLNWSYILGQLKEQKVATFFFHTLDKLALTQEAIVPEDALSKLKQTYYSVAEQNLRHYQRLKDLLVFLNNQGLEVILLKGMILAELVYNNLALRQMADVDLLVKREDLKIMKNLLLNFGYKQGSEDSVLPRFLENFAGEMYLFKDGFPFLDIHTSLCQYERFKGVIKIDESDVWQRRQRLNLDKVQVSILSAEDAVLHLCMHLSISHFFHKLSLFCDLRETIIYYEKTFNWNAFIQRAKDYRIHLLVYQSLRLTEFFLGSFIGKDVLEKLKPSRMKVALLNLVLMNKSSSLTSLKDERRKYVFQLLSLDFSLDILKLIFKVFFPSAEWLRYRYAIRGSGKYYLYRLLHPCLIFKTLLSGKMELRT